MSTAAPEDNTPAPPAAATTALSEKKLELDVRKLDLEISQLAAPWWRRPAFVLAALPTLLADA
jgi:hypothetical protein